MLLQALQACIVSQLVAVSDVARNGNHTAIT